MCSDKNQRKVKFVLFLAEYLEPNYGGPTPAQKINFEEQFEHVDYDYSGYRDLGNDNYFSKQMQKWSDGFWT